MVDFLKEYKEYMDGIDAAAYHKDEFRWEEDGYTVTRSYQYSPPGCHDSCGLLFYTKDGKLEKVEGNPYDPYAMGKLCMRCLNLAEAVNSPQRLKYPMKRAGERGENKWERISWEEAFDLIEEKVRDSWATNGYGHILVAHGTGRNINWLVPSMARLAFGTNQISMCTFTGDSCYMPRLCGGVAVLGDYAIADASVSHPDRYLNPEWRPPEVLVVWGNEPLTSNGDGFLGHWLVPCTMMGTKIISIDPRLTWWGARAEYHLAIRPGTDAALACAWLHVIIEEDLYDHEFVDYWCAGLEQLRESVKDCTPEWAAEICWLDADDIRESARLYASGNNSAIQWGLAHDQQRTAMSVCLACCDLMAITGNLDVPGGNVTIHNAFEINGGYSSNIEKLTPQARANKINQLTGLGADPAKNIDFLSCIQADSLVYVLESGQLADGTEFPIDMMWIESSNPLACMAQDAPRAYEFFHNIPFIVNADPFVTPTSVALADLILPVAMSCERNSARTWWTPLRSFTKVTSYYEAKTDEEIASELVCRLNPEAAEELGWTDDIGVVNWYIGGADGKRVGLVGGVEGTSVVGHDGCGMTFEELTVDHCGVAYDEWNSIYKKYEKGLQRPDGQLGFNTPSGRIELYSSTYYQWGLSPYPYHIDPPQGPVNTPELMEKYPLILTTGGRSFEFFHSEHRMFPTMREFHPLPRLTIHPDDAEKYGIVDGQWTWIENDHGRYRQIAYVTPKIRPGMVHSEHAWWYPETEGAEPNLFGTFDSNPNNVTVMFETGEGALGSSIKSNICRVYPYQEGDEMPGVVVTRKGGFKDYEKGSTRGRLDGRTWQEGQDDLKAVWQKGVFKQ